MTLTLQERKIIAQQDFYYLLLPLEFGTSPHSIAAHTRKIVHLLRGANTPSPCADAVDYLVRLYDRSAPANPTIVCKKGCSHCCSQQVSLSAPEAFHVAAQLRGRAATTAAVAEAARRVGALTQEQRWRDWPLCPMLAEGACSIYGGRPLGCHAFVSVRLASCITAFVDRGEPDIPMPQNHVSMLLACRLLFHAAMRLAGLRERAYEMNRAVHAILETEDAEARWLKGEDVLAGLEDPTPIPPASEREIAALTAFVAPTL